MEMLTRSEAEERIKEAVDDFLDADSLQEIMGIISGGEDFMVVEDGDIPDDETEDD
jgi:hypothetical protein